MFKYINIKNVVIVNSLIIEDFWKKAIEEWNRNKKYDKLVVIRDCRSRRWRRQ